MREMGTTTMDQASIALAQKEYISKVYTWMLGGLIATALTAMLVSGTEFLYTVMSSSLMWVVFIAQFGLVIALSGWINKMSVGTATLSFFAYSVLTGFTFALIFQAYTTASIYNTFFIAAGMYAALSFFGYVTKKDLSGMGTFLFMGLIGVIIASVVNIFFASSLIDFIVSAAGVLIFAGLTAYDTQRIKEMYVLQTQGDEVATKGAIIGALMLYLDFINLFLFLLRFLGNRN